MIQAIRTTFNFFFGAALFFHHLLYMISTACTILMRSFLYLLVYPFRPRKAPLVQPSLKGRTWEPLFLEIHKEISEKHSQLHVIISQHTVSLLVTVVSPKVANWAEIMLLKLTTLNLLENKQLSNMT